MKDIEYYKEKLRLNEERLTRIDKFVNRTNKVVNAVFSDLFYNKFKGNQDIPFEFLDTPESGDKLVLPTVQGGVIHTVKREKKKDTLIEYDTYWTSGSILLNHYHSNAIEQLEALEGSFEVILEVMHNGIKEKVKYTINKGEVLEIGAGVHHQTTSLEKGSLKVSFIYCPLENLTPLYI